MTLADACEMRRRMGAEYEVRRSGRRSPGVTPFYVCRAGAKLSKPPPPAPKPAAPSQGAFAI